MIRAVSIQLLENVQQQTIEPVVLVICQRHEKHPPISISISIDIIYIEIGVLLMTTEYFMTGLFTHVDDQFNEQGINGKHPQAKLYVSEVITLGLLFALKGGGNRAFYRWLSRDCGALFP